MSFAEIVSLLGKAIASVVAFVGVVVQIRGVFPQRGASLDELKTMLEIRKLLDVSDPDYQSLTAVVHERLKTLTQEPRKVSLRDNLKDILAQALLLVLTSFFAVVLLRKAHPWWSGILGLLAVGAVVNLVGYLTNPGKAGQGGAAGS
jgi:mannose/fructose/N-acetylgalactosamine-specific phosphotransferase system component IID